MLEHEWFIADNDFLARIMASGSWTLHREFFFSRALLPYYEAGISHWEGLDRETGHIIYRLSDLVDPEDRKVFAVYPSQDGSITKMLGDEGDEYESKWDSLEDWRDEWSKNHPEIPDHDIVQSFIVSHLQKINQPDQS